jgi:hypothetical protein
VSGLGLISSFYAALAECGCIARENLDWEAGNLYGNWLAIHPLLDRWISKLPGDDAWQLELIRGLFDYEFRRLQFVSRHSSIRELALTSSTDGVAIQSEVDIAPVIERLSSGLKLSPELLRTNVVVFSRWDDGSLHAYTLDDSFRSCLLSHQDDLIRAFKN